MKPDQRVIVAGDKSFEAMRAEWLKAIGDPESRVKKPPGDGWLTRDGIKQMLNLTDASFYRRMRALNKKGRVETFSGNQLSKDGTRLTQQVWYRLK